MIKGSKPEGEGIPFYIYIYRERESKASPTNHLDTRSVQWLEEWLANFKGATSLPLGIPSSRGLAFLTGSVILVGRVLVD